jgi:hypothetical protein
MGLLEEQRRRVEQNIQKSFSAPEEIQEDVEVDFIEISKGGKKTGFYTNTAENKAKHRVGVSYKKDKKMSDDKALQQEMDLQTSSILKERISKLKIDNNLMSAINQFISENDNARGISNLTYRGNLHYILDNITKEGLLGELQKINKNVPKKSAGRDKKPTGLSEGGTIVHQGKKMDSIKMDSQYGQETYVKDGGQWKVKVADELYNISASVQQRAERQFLSLSNPQYTRAYGEKKEKAKAEPKAYEGSSISFGSYDGAEEVMRHKEKKNPELNYVIEKKAHADFDEFILHTTGYKEGQSKSDEGRVISFGSYDGAEKVMNHKKKSNPELNYEIKKTTIESGAAQYNLHISAGKKEAALVTTGKVSGYSVAIAKRTGMNEKAVQEYINVNGLHQKALAAHIENGDHSQRQDFVTAVVGNPNNAKHQEIVAEFNQKTASEAIKMEAAQKVAEGLRESQKTVTDHMGVIKPMMPKEKSQEIARTIVQQMGGQKLIAMTGAKQFRDDGNGALSFRIPGKGFAKDGINHIRIELNAMDTYDMTFGKVFGGTYKEIASANGVYNDMLQEMFTKHTGLNTSLGTMGKEKKEDLSVSQSTEMKDHKQSEIEALAFSHSMNVTGEEKKKREKDLKKLWNAAFDDLDKKIPNYNVDKVAGYNKVMKLLTGGGIQGAKVPQKIAEDAAHYYHNYKTFTAQDKDRGFSTKDGKIEFHAFYQGEKHIIHANSQYEAKKKAIEQLKIPMSKWGVLGVESAKAMANEEFKFKSDEDLLEKSGTGEGSRGGKIIGHTKSGKPIYGNKSHVVNKESQLRDIAKYSGVNVTATEKIIDSLMLDRDKLAKWLVEKPENGWDFSTAVTGKVGNKYQKQLVKKFGKKPKDTVHIDYMDKSKGFATTRKDFPTYEAAAKWAKKEFESFNPDMVQYKSDEDTLEKGGEGSKGGQVIGHTKSGKAIYKNPFMGGNVKSREKHAGWTKEDHNDAANAHRGKMKEHTDKWTSDSYRETGGHQNARDWHKDQAKNTKPRMLSIESTPKGSQRQEPKTIGTPEQMAQKSEDDDLEKGSGEGSRGGKIRGHTKSGKPIYGEAKWGKYKKPEGEAKYGKSGFKGRTDLNHKIAADVLGEIVERMWSKTGIDVKVEKPSTKSKYKDGHQIFHSGKDADKIITHLKTFGLNAFKNGSNRIEVDGNQTVTEPKGGSSKTTKPITASNKKKAKSLASNLAKIGIKPQGKNRNLKLYPENTNMERSMPRGSKQ